MIAKTRTVVKISCRHIILICLAGLCLLSLAFAVILSAGVRSAKAEIKISDITSIKEFYEVGDDLVIPEAKIIYKGSEYTAVAITTFPDGSNSVSKSIKLMQPGTYSIYFRTVVDGKEVGVEKPIKVRQKTFSYDGLSNGYYATDTDDRLSEINSGESGQYVRLFRGNKMTYNSVIDLRKLNGEDFISFNVLPALDGSRDMSHIYITLTDAYNPEINLSIRVYSSLKSADITAETEHAASWQVRYAYIAASANESSYVGYEAGPDRMHIDDNFGSSALFSFYGYEQNMFYSDAKGEKKPQFLSLSYDTETKSLFQSSSIGKYIVTDLDDRDYNPEYVFGGFTTGEVFLSMHVDGVTSESAGILITDIAGQNIEREYLSDDFRPSIVVDTKGYDENDLPKAVVGMSYPLFSSYGRDAYSGILKTMVNVFYGYSTSSRYEVNVKDNAFVPSVPGTYTIRYTAKNCWGNSGEKLIKVIAVAKEGGEPQIGDVSYSDVYYAGEKIALKIPSHGCVSGECTLDVKVFYKENEVAVEKNYFRPLNTGTYTIVYTATDYLEQKSEKRVDITVTAKSTPVFIDDIKLPDYFLAGYDYKLPEIFAYTFNNGMKKTSVALSATGGALDKENRIFKPSKEYTDATVSYAAVGCTIQKSVPIINVKNEQGGLIVSEFFVKDNLNAVASESEIIFSVNDISKNAAFDFINPLIADGFSITFRFVSDKTRFSGITFTLKDENDRDIALPVVLQKSGKDAMIQVDANTFTVTNAFSSDESISLQYEKSTNSIIVNNDITLDLKTFGGFSGGRIVLEGKISGVFGDSAIAVSNISGQKISNATDDNVRASFAPENEISLTASIDTSVVIPKGYSADVFYPNSECTVTVFLPNGSVAVSEDGIELADVPADRNYSVRVSDYGTLQIRYRATADAEGLETRNIYYSILVMDEVAPEILLGGKVPISGKVGKALKLPSATAVDNVTENVTVSVLVICPVISKIIYLSENSFTPSYVGVYTIRYICADEVGNTAILDYQVTIK